MNPITINIKIPEQEYQITASDIHVLFPDIEDADLLQELEVREEVIKQLKYIFTYTVE